MVSDGATADRRNSVSRPTSSQRSVERDAYVSPLIDFLLLLAVSIPVALVAGGILLP